MVEFLPDGRLVGRERAADLAEDLGWGGGVGPPVGIGDQLHQRCRRWVWVTVRRKARHSHSIRLASGS